MIVSSDVESVFGTASCRCGVPSGRTADVIANVSGVVVVIVQIALGVGGAKPPVMPAGRHERCE